MAQRDKSPVVRVYLAAALQRVQPKDVWKIAEGLITRKEDVEDHNIPKMIWYGIEPTIQDNLTEALEKIKLSNLPFITQNIARRAVDANAMEQLAASLVKIPDPQLSEALKGTRDGLAGNPDIKAPSNWPAVYKALQEKQEVKNIALEIAQFFGDSEAAEKLLNTLKNKNAPLADRQLAIKALAEKQRKELATELPTLLEEPALRLYAIRATASYELAHLGSILLQQYPRYNSNEKSEAIQTLSSRSRYGRMLTNAIKTGDIPRRDIPAYIARQLRRVVGNGFVEVWGPIDPLSDNIASSFAKYEAFLTKEAIARADAKNGKTIFSQTCLACHTMYGEGGNLGPDITGSNRTNLTYLLSNILDPSGEIQDDYKMTIITTRDGRTYMGSIASEDDRQVTLRTVAKDDVVIGMQSIQSREESPLSIMPQGLIENLSEKEVLDLVKYLQSDGNI
ncbi:MAG: c-type cytochrome, partial [Cyclobacteriaceae bacterium]|nr:c-type cytochrome [Cyclobacteriaceae bacterium]